MRWDVVGLGNALMDALVVIDDDAILTDLGLVRGTMHPVDHAGWQTAYERIQHLHVTFDSGGSCANTIAAVGRLGGRALYCGQVGDDQMGHLYASRMTDACGGHALQFSRSENTGKCLSIISRHDAERTMLTDLGAAVRIEGLRGFADALGSARYAHFEGYALLPGPMQATAIEGMRVASAAGTAVSLDAADPFVVVAMRDLLWKVLEEHVSITFLNADEARQLTGLEPEPAIQEIADRAKLDTVVVKLGAHGSLVRHHGETVRVGIHRVTPLDTTGAGDAYAGGFLYGLSQGWDAQRCGRLGAMVAAYAVAQIGAVVRDGDKLRAAIDEIRP